MILNKLNIRFISAELKYIFFKKKYMALVDITDRCNLRCKHCYRKGSLSLKDNLTIDEWEKRFREYRKMGIIHIAFVGGEPSLRYDILKLAEKYFLSIDVYTNGQIKIPVEFHHRLLLSLEGLKKEDDDIRGPGSFEKSVSNYRGDKRVVIHSILSKANYRGPERLKEFIDFVRKMDVLGIRFTSYVPKKGEDNFFLLTDDQREEIEKVLLEEAGRKDSILLMPRGMVKFLYTTPLPVNICAADRSYFFDINNNQNCCVDPTNDCSRCLSLSKYDPPVYKFGEWFAQKSMLYKSLPR